MKISEIRKGESSILIQSFFSSAMPVVVILSYSTLPPMVSLLGTTLFIVLFFALVLSSKKKWKEILIPGVWRNFLLIIPFTSFGYYAFFYWGLKYTTAGNASIIALMETFFSYLLFHVWKKEEFSSKHLFGALLMLLGAATVLLPKTSPLNRGDFFILCAAAAAPIGNYFQQKVRKKISSYSIMFWRSLGALPLMWILTWVFKERIVPCPR